MDGPFQRLHGFPGSPAETKVAPMQVATSKSPFLERVVSAFAAHDLDAVGQALGVQFLRRPLTEVRRDVNADPGDAVHSLPQSASGSPQPEP